MSAYSSSVERWVKGFLIAITVLGIGSILGVLTITPQPAETEPAAVLAADEASRQTLPTPSPSTKVTLDTTSRTVSPPSRAAIRPMT